MIPIKVYLGLVTGTFIVLASLSGGCGPEPFYSPHPAGALPETGVEQSPPPLPARKVQKAGFTITPLASYRITALIIGAERYRYDAHATLSPVDLAAVWGPMSDADVLREMRFVQDGRWLTYQYPAGFRLSGREIARHIANIHAIPADDDICERVLAIRPGQVVRLTGYLVLVRHDRGQSCLNWRTSLYRSDGGGGACEVMWITEVETLS